MMRFGFASLTALVPLALVACGDDTVVTTGGAGPVADGSVYGGGTGGSGNGGASGLGLSVGDACNDTDKSCRNGLACTSGTCDFAHTTPEGSPCAAAGECADGLQCVPTPDPKTKRSTNLCTTPSATAGDLGANCLSDVDCKAGLRCGIVGFGAECVTQGTADVGKTCGVSADCYGGLICAPSMPGAVPDGGTAPSPTEGTCAPIPPSTGGLPPPPFGIPLPPSIQCEKPSSGKVQAYFDVPGATASTANGDFFRLPFPNDARITKGKIDLTGFPTPGSFFLGFDPVQIYVDSIVANESGWGAYPTTFFRFSGHIDFGSLSAGSGPSPVQYLDITDPANPANGGAVWVYSEGGGKYICQDWFAVRHPQGSPLVPGHVYTVYLTTAGVDKNGLPIERPPEIVTLLDDTKAPASGAGLNDAYAAYAPLRAYLKAQGISADTLLNATVFTVSPVRKPMDALAKATLAAPAPVPSNWVKCGGAAKSPCPQADAERACAAGTADYDEYHALIPIPIFQQGTEPYTTGGAIDSTKPRTEKVCASLTVPKKAAPAAGYPITVFAHGTGGSFRDHVRDEVAGALARATPPMAVLGYDQVEHGPRRGASTASPNTLFFNFKNPAAARGNPMQGGADVISMGRAAKALTVPASATGGAAIKFDPAGVVFFGHSQGSMHGSLGLPYTNDYGAAVLSGNGASLMHALLSKTAPQNIAQAVPFALGGDIEGCSKPTGCAPKLYGGDMHPVLTLLQQWIDPADPLNFAKAAAKEPDTGINVKSLFQTYGLGDSYSPPVTLQTYAIAADLALAAHDPSVTTPDVIAAFPQEQPVPLSGNFAKGGRTVTLALRQYANDSGKDGHFVVFDVPSANQDVVRFLSMAAAGQIPEVGK